ncbi:MAG TPA: hypothetical protein VN809_12915 [Telmatospirillum sp.]|nr:hypothetical protein [Telmatospirillum sp.]
MQTRETGRRFASWLFAFGVGALLMAPVGPAMAQERGHHDFHGRDVHRFDRHELGLWRTGGWRHEWHNGRLGWWWLVGGVWYFYERPVYPYPVVVSEIAFAEPVIAAPPPAVVVPGAPVMAAPPPQQPMWYYCDNPAGYYPYVATCATPFRAVPAKPQ